MFDETLAREFEEIFERDLKHCIERKLVTWARRPLLHKLKDFTAFLVNEQLVSIVCGKLIRPRSEWKPQISSAVAGTF